MPILGSFHHSVLEAHSISNFTGSQLENNFASEPGVSPISDLEDAEMRL
jgi:hypothetical protein